MAIHAKCAFRIMNNHVSTVPSPTFQVPVVYCVDLLIGRNLRWCASRELPKEQDMQKPSKVESLLRRGPGSLTGARPSLLDRLAPAMLRQCLAQYLKSMVLRPHSVTTQCDCTFITAQEPQINLPTWPECQSPAPSWAVRNCGPGVSVSG